MDLGYIDGNLEYNGVANRKLGNDDTEYYYNYNEPALMADAVKQEGGNRYSLIIYIQTV